MNFSDIEQTDPTFVCISHNNFLKALIGLLKDDPALVTNDYKVSNNSLTIVDFDDAVEDGQ